MAEKEPEVEVEVESGGKKKLILIIVGALVLVGGSVGGTIAFIGGGNSTDEVAEEVVEEEVRGDPSYVDLKPPFTVNLAPDDPVGFLQISMQLLTFDDDVAADIDKHKPLIRNNLNALFGKQKSAELRTVEGKGKLQKLALESVQSIVSEHGSGGKVDNIFFTTFVMQ